MNDTVEQTEEFLDVDFGSAVEYETLPTASYDLEIIDLAIKEKSENKRLSDLRMKQAEKPGTTLDQIDAYQWVFTFRVIAGEYEGETLTERMTRSFHENSKAGKLAAAALGMPRYNVAQARQMAEQAGVKGSALLMGKRVRAFVTDDEDNQGRHWNNIKEISMIPAPRPRPQRAPQVDVIVGQKEFDDRMAQRRGSAPQGTSDTPAVKQVQVPQLATDNDLWPEVETLQDA